LPPRAFPGARPRAALVRPRTPPYLSLAAGEARTAEGAMGEAKKGLAIEFINRIRTMDATELNAMIVREAGEDLAQFFLSYASNLISKDPGRVVENTSSLMLMGYLIRAAEDRAERVRRIQATLQA
jgi:hypothetical protein